MEELAKVWTEFIDSITIFTIVGMLLCLFLIIFVCIIACKNGAAKYLGLYLPVCILVGLLSLFSGLGTAFYYLFLTVISLFSFLVFVNEFRTLFMTQDKEKRVLVTRDDKAHVGVDSYINSIIKALQNMSKNDIGALIVLSNGNLPKQVLDSGVSLNAEISTQLIEGIFFPKAPLHDGAMIISGHKIRAAGCFLPLTQSLSYPKEMGTRHRAGIGITEVANVTSIIVSEETGIISIVKQGKVTRYADYDMLKNTLEEYYWKDISVEHKK